MTTSQFLMMRRDDLVVLGVRWTDCDFRAGANGASSCIVGRDNGAHIVLTFPSQAIAEEVMAKGPFPTLDRRTAQLAAASELIFNVRAGAVVPLTVDGILEALGDRRLCSLAVWHPPTIIDIGSKSAPADRTGLETESHPVPSESGPYTDLEMPWGLRVAPVAQSPDAVVVVNHAIAPQVSPTHDVALWQTHLRASDAAIAPDGDARLALKALHARPGGIGPMDEGHRRQVVRRSDDGQFAHASRLNLSALGGTLTALGRWDNFEWEHDLLFGRDQRVRFVSKGTLFPFGHRATLFAVTNRSFYDPPPAPVSSSPSPSHTPTKPRGPLSQEETDREIQKQAREQAEGAAAAKPKPVAVAGLFSTFEICVTEPIRRAVNDARLARQFPFDEVEILEHKFAIADPGTTGTFLPTLKQNMGPVRFPIRLASSSGAVFVNSPLLFVADYESRDDQALRAWDAYSRIELPGVAIDLVRGPTPEPTDRHEVHGLRLEGFRHTDGFRAKVIEIEAELTALRTILPDPPERVTLTYRDDFLSSGSLTAPLTLRSTDPAKSLEINFVNRPDRSGGLVSPKFVPDVISRSRGPVPAVSLQGLSQQALTAFEGTTLLGLPLRSIIKTAGGLQKAPQIVPIVTNGAPVGAKMQWDLQLENFPPLRVTENSKLTLDLETTQTKRVTTCTVTDFSYDLPAEKPLLTLQFKSVKFTALQDDPPHLEITGLSLHFAGELALLQDLATEAQKFLGFSKPVVRATSSGITAGYGIAIPRVAAVMFVMQNIGMHIDVDVPFSNRPITVALGFGRRDNPFAVTVMGLGGGGYIEVRIDGGGLTGFEVAMEFGAMLAVNFVIAAAEVHAFGGIRLAHLNGMVTLTAFLRFGGSVEILGLVAISIELVVELRYAIDKDGNSVLTGRAALVIEIDLTLFSEAVTLDSGDWTLVGSKPEIPPAGPHIRAGIEGVRRAAEWKRYQESFAA